MFSQPIFSPSDMSFHRHNQIDCHNEDCLVHDLESLEAKAIITITKELLLPIVLCRHAEISKCLKSNLVRVETIGSTKRRPWIHKVELIENVFFFVKLFYQSVFSF